MTVILLTSGAVLLLTGVVYFAYEFLTFRQTTVRQLSTLGEIISANSTAALAFYDQADANEILSALQAERHFVAAGLYDLEGNLFSSYPPDLPPAAFPAAPEADGYRFGDSHLVGFQPVVQGNKRLGTLFLKADMEAMYARFRLYGGMAILLIGFSFVVAYLLSNRLQQQISKPILALAETAKAVSDHRDYSVRATKLGEDELGLLTDAFNQMLMQIQEQNQALRDSAGRLRAVLNSSLTAVVVIDADGRISDWNARAEKMFGWSHTEARGQLLGEIMIPARYRDAHQQGIKRFLATGEGPILNRQLEMTALRRDGSEFPVELSVSLVKTDEQVTFCGFVTDITERKRADESLKQQAAVLENMTEGVNVADPDGTIFFTNPAFDRIFGYERGELLGQKISVLNSLSPEENTLQISTIMEALKAEGIWRGDLRNRKKDGTCFYTSASICAQEIGGKLCWISVQEDITKRKQAESELKRFADELQASNQDLERFAYVASHDLKTPLRGISSLAHWLRAGYSSKLDERGIELLNLMTKRIFRLNDLIEGILHYSRVSREVASLVEIDLNEVVASAVDLISPPAHITITVPKPLPILRGNLTRLTQIFQNLLSNSVKFVDKPVGQISVSCEAQDDKWLFCLSDNGPGIDKKYFDKIFEIFQTLHPRDVVEGTGVGLTLVKKIVEISGGKIWVESRVGEGTEFYFTLPQNEGYR